MNKFILLFSLCIGFMTVGCQSKKEQEKQSNKVIGVDIQGHRGARGLLPENSIAAMLKAVELGVNTLECDLAVTKDGILILSHEPWMNHDICLDSAGKTISEEEAMRYNIYQMTYDEVQGFDCGSRGNFRFPQQVRQAAYKPSLIDMVTAVSNYANENSLQLPKFNIEIKSMPQGDGIYHPSPEQFSDMVYETLDSLLPWDRVIIQSFDFRVLQYFNRNYRDVTLAALIENDKSASRNIDSLGFLPDIYSSYYSHLTQEDVNYLHEQNIMIIPWTVNEVEEMKKLVSMGVDGLITDYPDRAIQFK